MRTRGFLFKTYSSVGLWGIFIFLTVLFSVLNGYDSFLDKLELLQVYEFAEGVKTLVQSVFDAETVETGAHVVDAFLYPRIDQRQATVRRLLRLLEDRKYGGVIFLDVAEFVSDLSLQDVRTLHRAFQNQVV